MTYVSEPCYANIWIGSLEVPDDMWIKLSLVNAATPLVDPALPDLYIPQFALAEAIEGWSIFEALEGLL